MNAYKTYAQIDASGRIVLEGLPFQAGALVEVLLLDQSPVESEQRWVALMRHVQQLPQVQQISEADIAAEIEAVRATK